jgi:DNA-binding CsgD family transcriptional regulator
MESLSQRDVNVVLEFLRKCYASRDIDSFGRYLTSAISKVVPCENAVFANNSSGKDKGKAETGNRGIQRALPPSGHDHEMVVRFPTTKPVKINFALHRAGRDFTERERLILKLLRPHLIQAYRNAEAASNTQLKLKPKNETPRTNRHGSVILDLADRIRFASSGAHQLLIDYFGQSARHTDHLPEMLERWVQNQERKLDQRDEVPSSRAPMVTTRAGKALIVRLVDESDQRRLLLEEHVKDFTLMADVLSGLTRRESEVLSWVSQGKTNSEVANILGISRRTVDTFLSRTYQKLGVETRMAAVMRMIKFIDLSVICIVADFCTDLSCLLT